MLNLLPLLFARVLYKHRDSLDSKEKKEKFGTLYQGLSLKETPPKKLHIWIHPMIFMFRRTLFIVLSVVLFDHPVLQMAGHCLLTLATAIYLSTDSLFVSKARQAVEVGNEILLLFTSQLILQCIRNVDPEQRELLGDLIFASLILLGTFNVAFIVYTLVLGCKEKCRTKTIAAKKAVWLEARR